MQFYTVNGMPGLNRAFEFLTGDKNNWAKGMNRLKGLLAVGIDESRRIMLEKDQRGHEETEAFLVFLFPDDCPPLYVFMDYKLLTENWYEIGRWNFAQKTAPRRYTLIPVNFFRHSQNYAQGITANNGVFNVNLTPGTVYLPNRKPFDLAAVTIEKGKNVLRQNYPGRGRWHYLYLTENETSGAMFGIIADYQVKDTVLVKLFFENQLEQDYLKPVSSQLPMYLVCKVQGDKYSSPEP